MDRLASAESVLAVQRVIEDDNLARYVSVSLKIGEEES
jgi:hypothetical protein